MLLHFKAYAEKDSIRDELAFNRHTECIHSIGEIHEGLGCLCLRYSTDDDLNHMVSQETFGKN